MARVLKTGNKATKARVRRRSTSKGRKSAKTKRRIAPSVTRQRVLSVADLQAQLERRTVELDQALERQTATADILRVIASSPAAMQPVFDAIAERANKLVGGHATTVLRIDGDMVGLAAFTPVSEEADRVLRATFPIPIRGIPFFEMVQRGEMSEIRDTESEMYARLPIRNLARARGFRSRLLVPLRSDSGTIGAISVTRVAPGTFAEHHVQLLQTFADQAVIAIQNARLFKEVQARTDELAEALNYQIGSANILRVIASSPTDVEPVLAAIVESACELCGAYDAVLLLKEGEYLRFSAHHGPIPMSVEKWPINRRWASGRAFIDQMPIHVHDLLAEEDEFPDGRELSQRMGHRSILAVPLLRENESIGAVILRRIEVNPFNDKQIALLQTFADQAVIAISNVRLFEEVQARTEDLTESLKQQTATAEVLKTISQSTFDLEKVLQTLVESAAHLCDAEKATITRRKDGVLYRGEFYGFSEEFIDYVRNVPVVAERGSATARALLEGVIVHIPDVTADPEYTFNEAQKLGDFRTILAVPMMREGTALGVIAMTRPEVRSFTNKQIELVKTFADQAAIAIENARLLNELRERTTELSRSLDDLRIAQDRLVQTEKLASLGQLTAGIAHEIKNPLNFVNNFSALSVELIDELNDLLKQSTLAYGVREEVDELTGHLKDNLGKVVQHGKRADSIVKNMLLHSRQADGEFRPADINALVDESLSLAYHGARAENPQFNVTVQRHFDPGVGVSDVFPQEITRVLLNLISNGFYAVSKRKAENGDAGFEPVLSATTHDHGDRVEIRIRDNGSGIPPEVKEKIFNPFFTTKPAGEGTGLGLSMSYDIVVKQHGGRIDVDTKPGAFTEFIVTLPRKRRTIMAGESN